MYRHDRANEGASVLTIYNKIAAFGCTVAAAGFLACIYFYFFTPVYAGASGAGLAILAGMIALALGSMIAVISFLVGLIRTSRRP